MTDLLLRDLWQGDETYTIFEGNLESVQMSVKAGVSPKQLPPLSVNAAALSLALAQMILVPIEELWDITEWSNFDSIGLSRKQALEAVAEILYQINAPDDAKCFDIAARDRDRATSRRAGVPEGFKVLSKPDDKVEHAVDLILKTLNVRRLSMEELDAEWAALATK